MKEIKNLGIKTQEGFEIKNLQRFPSREWGDEGGLQADIYYKDEKIAQYYDAGDGGMANMYWTDYGRSVKKEAQTDAIKFLQRCDADYRPGSKYYDLLFKDQKPQNFDEDDWGTLIILIEEHYDKIKMIKETLKNNPTVIVCSNDQHILTLGYKYPCLDKYPDVIASFKERIIDDIATGYLTRKYPKEKFTNFAVYLKQELENLNTL